MDVEQIFIYFLMALAAILAVVFTGTASVVMLGVSAKAMRWFGEVDKALVPFGNTPTGQYINQQLRGLVPLVDEPDDKAVQTALAFMGSLVKRGVMDGKALSTILSEAVGLAVELTDGREMLTKEMPPVTGQPLELRYKTVNLGTVAPTPVGSAVAPPISLDTQSPAVRLGSLDFVPIASQEPLEVVRESMPIWAGEVTAPYLDDDPIPLNPNG